MAHIEKRGAASYRLTIDLGRDGRGRKRLERKTVRIQDPAILRSKRRLDQFLEMELAKFQLEVQSGSYVASNAITFAEFVEQWLARHVDAALSDKTQYNYRYHLDREILPFFGSMKMGQIRTADINDFVDQLRLSKIGSATSVYIYRVLRSIFKHATEWKVIGENPIIGSVKPKEGERKEINVYDEAELDQLFRALDKEPAKLRCAVLLALTGGLRRGEIAGLEWKHIDLEARTVEIRQSIPMNKDGEPVIKAPKTRRSIRKIAIPALLVDHLTEFRSQWELERKYAKTRWSGKGEFLFCHESGKPHDPNWFTDNWMLFRARHKLRPIRFHDLRHTAATWMIKAGVHPKAIANRLGHQNIKTTMDVYSHILESVDQAAAEVFDSMPAQGLRRGAVLGIQSGSQLGVNPANEAQRDQEGQHEGEAQSQ